MADLDKLIARLNELCGAGNPSDPRFAPSEGSEGTLLWMFQPFGEGGRGWGYVLPLDAKSYSSEHALIESDDEPAPFAEVIQFLVHELEGMLGLDEDPDQLQVRITVE